MLQKRRLTVQPVDAAQFCGHDNTMVVSYLNGVDHLVLDPAATDQDDAQPLPSRVMAHTYAGAQLADAAVNTQRECVAEAAVSAAGVVACRVTPLVASKADPTAAYPVRGEGASKIVFLSGCQRLAEVQLGEDSASVAGAAEGLSAPLDSAAYPMQCFRVAASAAVGGAALDVAAFMADAHTLCACTPQLGKLQTMRFDEQHVACTGPGRIGRTEVTVMLSSGVPVLCGMAAHLPDATGDEESDVAAEEQQKQQQRGDSSASSCSLNVRTATAAQRAFAAANRRSNLRILHTLQLPADACATTDTTAAAATAVGGAARRVAWSGGSTLWIVYADGTVMAAQCAEASAADNYSGTNNDNEESQQPEKAPGEEELAAETTLTVQSVARTLLTSVDGQPLTIGELYVNADPRASVLHLAFTSTPKSESGRVSRLYYGTVRLSEGSAAAAAASSPAQACADAAAPSSASLQWRLQWMPYDEQLYGVRFERGQFHALTQSSRGGGPLYVAALPRNSPVHSSHSNSSAATAHAGLAAAIIASPERELARYCCECEELLRQLHTAAQRMSCEDDAASVLHRLMQAQHALYALLRRQHESMSVTDLSPSESVPYRLLQRAARLYRQLSAYVLLLRLGVLDTVTKPLYEVLRLKEAASLSAAAQGQWSALMRDTFRSGSVYQSAVSELAMWESSTPLCIDLLLRQLGLTAAAGDAAPCTMASVLSKMDTLTTEYALFILYYSYQVMGCAGDEAAGGAAVPSHAVQQQQRQWRESFLLLFGQSIELNTWSFACYAVDHGINPAELESEDAANAAPRYLLGPAVHHLGAPPLTDLLAPLLNGLAHVAALDVLVHTAPSCLAVYTAAAEQMPLSVAMRLLCVAVRIGSHRLIEALHEAMRGSPLRMDLAAQPLAFAALAARDVSGLRGWVEVGGPVAATIERTLQASENIHQRESVLIAFYILMQRYEDAMRVCSAATAADAAQAQRLQVVVSYLRSLLTVASTAEEEGEAAPKAAALAPVASNDVDPLLPLTAAALHPWSPSALGTPLLDTSVSGLAEKLQRGLDATAGQGRGFSRKWIGYGEEAGVAAQASAAAIATSGPSNVGCPVSPPPMQQQQPQPQRSHVWNGSAPPNAARPPVFRPSTLLASVERSAGSHSASSPSPGSTAQQLHGF